MTKRMRSVPMIFNHVRFGNDCLACRLEAKLTGRALQELISFDITTLYKYERGVEGNMKMANMLELANLYDLDPRDYFELER